MKLVGERFDKANGSSSLFCSARPPDTMIFALVSSGRSDLAISDPAKVEVPGVACAGDRLDGGGAATVRSALANAVPRTVSTFFASDDLTVAMALPA